MDATTKERADCSPATPLTIASLDGMSGRLSERQALVAEYIVRSGLAYEPGGRGVSGAGVDGFGFIRLAVMAATGRQVADLFGYVGWPEQEPRGTRIANLLEDWGLTQVGGYEMRDYQRGDVLVYDGIGPTAEIVVSPGNQDRAAITAFCLAPEPPKLAPLRAMLQRHLVRVYRWVEA